MRVWTVAVVLVASLPAWGQDAIKQRLEVAQSGGRVAGWAAQGVEPGVGQGITSSAGAVLLHGPGVRFEGPTKTGAPYSAEAITETVQALADGNRITREHRAKVYRDSQGRTRREEKLEAVGPWAVAGGQPTRIFINDPVAGVHWILEPEQKIARKMQMPTMEGLNVTTAVSMSGAVSGTIAHETAEAAPAHRVEPFARVEAASLEDAPQIEDLGVRMIEGVEAKGSRVTRTIPAGQIGNERPIEIVFERWISEELGLDVMTKRSDPRSAETTYKLTNVQRVEPLSSLFEPPPDFTVDEGAGNTFFNLRLDKAGEK